MKKLFSKSVAALLSVACVGSLMTLPSDDISLFAPVLVANADSGISFSTSKGELILCGNVDFDEVREYANNSEVRTVKAVPGTVLPSNCQDLFRNFKAVSIDLSNVDSSKVTNMNHMFANCTNLETIDLSNFNTKNVTEMFGLFQYSSKIKTLDLSSFDTRKVRFMDYMFYHCSSLEELNVRSFDTAYNGGFMCMFDGCTSLRELDISNFKSEYVTSFYGMFQNCKNLKSLDLSGLTTPHLKCMSYMFRDCSSLESIDLSNFNPKELDDLYGVFSGCSSLKHIDLKNFNTRNVTEIYDLFRSCESLEELDLSSFDTNKVTAMHGMFYDCKNLKWVFVSDKWSTEALKPLDCSDYMFYNCKSIEGENGTTYASYGPVINSNYACIDTDDTPGYLSHIKNYSSVKNRKKTNDSSSDCNEFAPYDAFVVNSVIAKTIPNVNQRYDYYDGDPIRIYEKNDESGMVRITKDGESPQKWIRFDKTTKFKKVNAIAKTKTNIKQKIKNQSSSTGKSLVAKQSVVVYYISGNWAKITLYGNEWVQLNTLEILELNSKCSESGHDYGEWKITNKPSCTEKGKKVRICTRAGCNHEDTEILEPVAHNKVWEISKDPTCELDGEQTLKCYGCGTVFDKKSLPAIGHDYKENICTRCGKTVSFNVKNVAELMPLCFGYNGEAFDMDRYPIQNYNGKNVICFEFTTNYPWSVSAPHYINIHNKETCEPITNGGAGTYSLYIWMDSDLYWGKIIGSIKDHHYSEISKPQEITFNVQGAVFSYSIDPFHINEIPAHDYFANKVSEISDFATDGKYDIIDYICGRVITGGSTKTLYYKDNKFYCFKSELIDEFSLSIDYSVKEPANTSIDSHSYIVNDDIFYTVPFDLYTIAVASVDLKNLTAYKDVLDFSGGSAGISVHIYPGTILELDQNGFCTWCYNPTNDNDYTYWYFYNFLDHMVRMN